MLRSFIVSALLVVNMSGSQAGSIGNGADTGNVKRTVTLTEKALACKIEKLQKDRQSRVNKIKGVIIALKELMNNDDNALQVQNQLDILMQMVEDVISLHESLMPLIQQGEQQKRNAWFTSISKYNQAFIVDVKQWLSENDKLAARRGYLIKENLEELPNNADMNDEPHPYKNIPSQQEQDVLFGTTHDEIMPNDSISNVTSRRHGSKSRTSISSTTSARVKAEADMAAYLTRQRLLKGKHELEQQEEEIRKRKERFELEVEIVASVAKVNILRASRGGVQSSISNKSNGMESYSDKKERQAQAALNAEANSFVPCAQGKHENPIPAKSVPESHLTGTRPKGRENAMNVESGIPQQRPMKIDMTQNTNPVVITSQLGGKHAPVPVAVDSNDLISIMARQNEITAMLVHQQNLSSLPNKEMQVFDGDPLLYHAFMRAFE